MIPRLTAILPICLALAGPAKAGLELVSELRLPKGAGEILTLDPAGGNVFGTDGAKGLVKISLADPHNPKVEGTIDLRKIHPGGLSAVSSVAADPAGRGLVAAALIPKNPIRDRGLVVLIDSRSGQVIHRMESGWHPDCVSFSKDGRWLLVANEGEFRKFQPQTPGSLGVCDLSGLKDLSGVGRLVLKDHPLGPREVVAGVRTPHESDPSRRHLDLEPEYVTSDGRHAYVSLQENNAIAVFDLKAGAWSRVIPLGSWPVRMDVSDRDGPWGRREINVTNLVEAMPMPDTISVIEAGGRLLIASANEGEGEEVARVKHLGTDGPPLAPELRAELKKQFGIDPQQDAALGRLQVSKIDGLDASGRISKLHAAGTRSFSLWDAATGRRVYDSGSYFEDFAAGNDPSSFNTNGGKYSEWDRRSDNRGPETEAIATARVRGVPMVFVANERQNGLFAFNLSSPSKPSPAGYYNGRSGRHSAPECILSVPAKATRLGQDLIVTAWEGSSSITIHLVTP